MRAKAAPRGIVNLAVRPAARLPGEPGPRGWLRAGAGPALPCALGRGGATRAKREGDGGTPAGTPMRLLYGWYRPDRFPRPRYLVPLAPLPRRLGWCDEPGAALYNRPAPLPMTPGHEEMWRRDGLYDVVLVLDWNIAPRRAGRGSAIFLHCAKRPEGGRGLKPTLGCVALRPGDMRRLLPRLGRAACLVVL